MKFSYLHHRSDTNMEISTHYQVPPQNLCRLANIELYYPTLAFQSSPSLQNFQLLQLLSPPLSFLVYFGRQAQTYFLSLTFPSTAFRENLLSPHLCVSGVEGGICFISFVFLIGSWSCGNSGACLFNRKSPCIKQHGIVLITEAVDCNTKQH